MTLFKIIFSIWIFLYVYIGVNTFIPSEKTRLFTFINFSICTIMQTIIILYTNPFIVFLAGNILVIAFLIIEFFENIKNLFVTIYIIYLDRFAFEFLMLITLKLFQVTAPSSMLLYMFTSCLTILFNYTFKDFLMNLVSSKKDNRKSFIIKNIINVIVLLIIIIVHIPGHPSFISNPKIFYFLFILIVSNLVLSLFLEKMKTQEYIQTYQKIVEYSEFTEGLLTEYKSFIHEYKNKLIIIKGLAEENPKELQEYINSILNEKISNNYHWLMDIKNIPIPGIKGLVNYKLLKMKELNIEAEVYVSEEVASLNKNQLDIKEKNNLYTIMGVILDNAIEASIESDEKMISLQFFKEDDDINIILANTFKSINLDQLEEKGYSSKGKNRGIGLYLVKEILKHSKNIAKETSIRNNFFVQKIIIKNIK